jgi:hypothetical protein
MAIICKKTKLVEISKRRCARSIEFLRGIVAAQINGFPKNVPKAANRCETSRIEAARPAFQRQNARLLAERFHGSGCLWASLALCDEANYTIVIVRATQFTGEP